MMYKKLVFVLVFVAPFVFSSHALAAGNAKAGKDKAAACAGCHGADGNSMVPNFPKLAGQYEAYIVKQVDDFLKGKRSDATMGPMAASAGGPQDLADIAAWFASQKTMKGTPSGNALAAKGKKLYLSGDPAKSIYACVNCHGKNGKGLAKNNPFFPVVGGQHKDYLKKTLTDFKTRARSNDPGGMMANIAKHMSDRDIDAVTEYLSGL